MTRETAKQEKLFQNLTDAIQKNSPKPLTEAEKAEAARNLITFFQTAIEVHRNLHPRPEEITRRNRHVELQKESVDLNNRLDDLLKLWMNGIIDRNEFSHKSLQIGKRQKEIIDSYTHDAN